MQMYGQGSGMVKLPLLGKLHRVAALKLGYFDAMIN